MLQLYASGVKECSLRVRCLVTLLRGARSTIVSIALSHRLMLSSNHVGIRLLLKFFEKRKPYPDGT